MRLATKLNRKAWLVAIGGVLLTVLLAGCGQSAPAPSSMEVVHGSYLHVTGNITDLRARVTEWQGGNADSLKLAGEKLERVDVVLASTGWPKEMAKSVARAKAAVGPMAMALKDGDRAAAEKASAEFGEASHDIIHEFYGDYLPAMEGMPSNSQMAAHVILLDLAGNLADLQTRIAQWQKGDEGSMGVAREKAERTEILMRDLYPTGVLAKDLPPIQRSLLGVFTAIEQKDAKAAAEAAKAVAVAAAQLNRDTYSWMELVRAGSDPSCVQASYLDLSKSIADLRSGATAWTRGDEAVLGTVSDKLARVDLLLMHTTWPSDLTDAIERTRYASWLMSQAIKDRNRVAMESASAEFGEASHDVTHAFYGDWLPGGGLKGAKAQAGTAAKQAQTAAAGGHAHGGAPVSREVVAEGPNWGVLGAFGAAMALVVVAAALTKPKARSMGKASLPTVEA